MPLVLHKTIFLKRYKRFLSDILMEEQVTTVHCPNSGSMKGLTLEGSTCWVSHSSNPERKLKYTLELIESEGTLVGVNTQRTNHIAYQALKEKKVSELSSYSQIKREIPYRASRIDFLLTEVGHPDAYVEVKNVTLKENKYALFPDAPTSRGTKHLLDLIQLKTEGHRAIIFYVIQRNDCEKFSIANKIDPLYCETLEKAMQCGVEVLAYQCNVTPLDIVLERPVPLALDFK
jgi:sugar fermentation stimulation protein A